MMETEATPGPALVRNKLAGASVFVTGATGFIGSHLLRRLNELGADICVLVRPDGGRDRLPPVPRLRVLEGDITDGDAVRAALVAAQPRYVFHLAAYTQVGREPVHTEIAMRVNLHGTMRLTEAVTGLGVEAVVNSGTCEEYGDGEPPLTEESPLRPVSPYSVSKAAATLWCAMMHRTVRCPVVTVRPFLCYGPGQEPVRLVPQAIIAALEGRDLPMTGGEQTRELTHVSDIVEGYLHAAVVPEAIGHVINLGSAAEHRVRDVVEKVYRLVGGPGRPLIGAVAYRQAELWRCVSGIGKAQHLLGWSPRVGLDEGLRDTVTWYVEHRKQAVKATV